MNKRRRFKAKRRRRQINAVRHIDGISFPRPYAALIVTRLAAIRRGSVL